MGLLSFLKGAGAKVFGKSEEKKDEEKADLIREHVKRYGFLVEDLKFSVNGERLTLSGKVDTLEIKNKVIVAAGNIEGISEVDDLLEVKNPPAEPEPENQFYTVQKGDTLSKISKQYYGNANKYPIIFEANKPMLKSPDLIYPGQMLLIPPIKD